jgi:hypothetical protein
MTDEKDSRALPAPKGTLQLSGDQAERLSRKYGFSVLTQKDIRVLPPPKGTLQLSGEQGERLSRKYGFSVLTLWLALCPSAEGTMYARFDLNDAREEVSRILLNTEIGPEVSGTVGRNAEVLYLAAMMLEACWASGSLPPPSLKQLVLDSLASSRLLSEARNDLVRHLAAMEAVEVFEPDENISRPKLTTRLDVEDGRARRWLNEGFAKLVEEYRRRKEREEFEFRPANEPTEES